MKLKGFIFIFMLLISFIAIQRNETQAQTPFTNTGKAKNIIPTVDTFSIPGVTGAYRQGIITNQSTSKNMYVMFSKRDGTKDTSSRVQIPYGKTLYFNFVGTKIFRYTATGDTVFSQIVIGDVKLNYNDKDFKDLDLSSIKLQYQSDVTFAYYLPESYRDERMYASEARRKFRT